MDSSNEFALSAIEEGGRHTRGVVVEMPPDSPGPQFTNSGSHNPLSDSSQRRRAAMDGGARHFVRRASVSAARSVGDFFGVTQESQSRMQDAYGSSPNRAGTLRRRLAPIGANSYADVSQIHSIGDVNTDPLFSNYQDGGVPPGMEHMFITDPQEALAYYFNKMEGGFFENEFFVGPDGPDSPISPTVSEDRRSKGVKRTFRKAQSQTENVKKKLKALPSFWPYFTIFILLVDIIATIVVIIVYIVNNTAIAPVHLLSTPETSSALKNSLGNTFNVSLYAGASPNMWIGPSVELLILSGAQYSPCMRTDQRIITYIALREETEDIILGGLGCCINGLSAGTVLLTNCRGTYTSRTVCSNVSIPAPIVQNNRPCCVGIMGHCQVTTEDDCRFLGGVYHDNADSCRNINCFGSICGMFGTGISTISGTENRPAPAQWWRWITSLFFHAGLIHLTIVCIETLIVCWLVERTSGFIRVMLIYFITGIGGNMFGSIFAPYGIHLGASPAIMGLSAVFVVEFFQTLQALEKKWQELLRLIAVVGIIWLVNLILGLFPYIDNWSNIGGFLFGIPCSLVFLPYITFGKWDAVRKRIVLAISVPILILMYFVLLVIFFIANTDFCGFCKYLSCVPFITGVCEFAYNFPQPETDYSY